MMFMSRWLSFGHLLLLSRLDIVIPGLSGDLFAVSGCNTGRLLLRSPVRVNAP